MIESGALGVGPLVLAMTDPMLLVFAALGAVGAGVAMWFGWRNLEQAKLLKMDVHPRDLERYEGQAVTVVGSPASLYGGDDPFLLRALWFRKKFQEYRHSYNNNSGSWRTVREEVADWDLQLEVGPETLTIQNDPSEVYGTTTETLGGGFGSDYRTVNEWLPCSPRLTVCGLLRRRGRDLWLLPHPRHGLLYATEPPHARAKKEELKGWLGLVGAPLLAVGLIGYLLTQV